MTAVVAVVATIGGLAAVWTATDQIRLKNDALMSERDANSAREKDAGQRVLAEVAKTRAEQDSLNSCESSNWPRTTSNKKKPDSTSTNDARAPVASPRGTPHGLPLFVLSLMTEKQHPPHAMSLAMTQATLMKVSQVASRLNCSASTVYALVEGKKFGCHRVGNGRGAIRVSEDDLQSFLDKNHVAPAGRGSEVISPPRPRVKLKHIRL